MYSLTTPRCVLILLAALALVSVLPAPVAHAQTENHHAPGHPPDEADAAAKEAGRLEKDRFNPDQTEFSFFGHTRQRLTLLDDFLFGEEFTEGDWFYTHRYYLGGEFHSDHIRGVAEISAAFVEGSQEGNSPVEENRLAVQRAWIEADLFDRDGTTLAIRAGRDEWRLGSQRLVGWRDGTNVRRRFDGVRLFYHDDTWDAQILGGFEVENDIGALDDNIADNRALWGVYGTRTALFGLPGMMDIYYLGFYDEAARALDRVGEETRHSIGTRLWGREHGWDWNFEFVYQFGRFDDGVEVGDISAWTAASVTGYTFHHTPLSPRIALSANIASGDRDPESADVGSFNALFPRGSYFSEVAQLGPRNFYNLNPYLTLELAEGLELIMDVNFYWRLSTEDGVYGPPGNLLFEPEGSEARFVNRAFSANLEYEINEHVFVSALYTRSAAGRFISEAAEHDDSVDFLELTLRVDF